MEAILISAAVAALASLAAGQTLSLKGPAGQTTTISVADFASLPRVSVAFDTEGQKAIYEGPLLIDVLAKVGTPTGKALRGSALCQCGDRQGVRRLHHRLRPRRARPRHAAQSHHSRRQG